MDSIVAGSAKEMVEIGEYPGKRRASGDIVVSSITIDEVDANAAIEAVMAVFTAKRVVAPAAFQRVIATSAVKDVVAEASDKRIGSSAAHGCHGDGGHILDKITSRATCDVETFDTILGETLVFADVEIEQVVACFDGNGNGKSRVVVGLDVKNFSSNVGGEKGSIIKFFEGKGGYVYA